MINIENLIRILENIRDNVSSAKWTIMDFIASGDIEECNNLWMPFESYEKLQNVNYDLANILAKLHLENKGEEK